MEPASLERKRDIAALKRLQNDETWPVVMRMLNKRLISLGEIDKIVGQDAYQELKQLHKRIGGVEELKRFFNDLERGAFDDE